jgi:nucleoside 2-deoxyribosyltransferase
MGLKIYFASAIRGFNYTENSVLNKLIIDSLKTQGHEVLSEHIGDESIRTAGEINLTDKQIHDRDMQWITDADVIIAEVSNPSLGVGYEIGRALDRGKRILCLFKTQSRRLSAMIRGSDKITVADYKTPEEAMRIITEYLNSL